MNTHLTKRKKES